MGCNERGEGMIILQLAGRTANQLTQYLFARQFTDEIIYTLPCPINGDLLKDLTLNEVNVKPFSDLFPLPFNTTVYNVDERTMNYDPELVEAVKLGVGNGSNILLKGYWQNPQYIKPELRRLTEKEGSKFGHTSYPSDKYVAVHIRGTDYLGWKLFDVCDKDYYRRALKYFYPSQVKDVYTDDLNYAQMIMEGIECNFMTSSKEPIEDLLKMSRYWNIITPNSSFSGLAAGINNFGHKKIIQPKRWFNSDYASDKEMDCYPQWENAALI